MKPRRMRLDVDGDFRPVQAHSYPLIVLGGFVLLFGFFAFNAGSMLTLQSETAISQLGLICINTILSAASSGLVMAVLDNYITHELNIGTLINGLLAGGVAVCAGANVYEPWASLLVGGIGGLVCLLWTYILPRFRIDDSVNVSLLCILA
jgi:Amt family ammonium transporter